MTTLKDLLQQLGGLHDAVVTRLTWSPGDRFFCIEVDDLCGNFEGLPEYPGAVPGRIELGDVRHVLFDINTSEPRLAIQDFEVEQIDATQYRSSLSFWPAGRITVLHAHASFPTVRLRPVIG